MDPNQHAERRRALLQRVGGPILLLGNGQRARNLPMVELPFRQDSTFLYFTGCHTPGAALYLDEEEETLFLPPPHPDDPLWHGPQPGLVEQGEALGFGRVEPTTHLVVRDLSGAKTLAIPDESRNRRFAERVGTALRFGRDHGDEALMDAVIELRRAKTEAELVQMREAAAVSAQAHIAVMKAVRPGATEHELTVLFESVLALHGATPGYGTILTVRGEVLHNHFHGNTLQQGELLLLDGGGEIGTGYGVDITRTTPVSGTFTPRQRAAYDAVLASQLAAIDRCRTGVRYREVHDTACRILARYLRDEGLLRCDVDTALETGAHGLFYPHGTGHLLGMDVHDLENFGDRPSYPLGTKRPEQFGTRNLRLDLPLEPGWVVTIEPGFYVVPAILEAADLRERYRDLVDFDKAAAWQGFGGIRIEDDIVVTTGDPENLTAATPKRPEEVEALVNTGPSVRERLS